MDYTIPQIFELLTPLQIRCMRECEKINKKLVSAKHGIIFNEVYICISVYIIYIYIYMNAVANNLKINDGYQVIQ